jgi:hypothetical protein
MVTSTRTTRMSNVGYDHVVSVLMNLGVDTPVRLCMQQNGIATAYNVASLCVKDVKCLTYNIGDDQGVIQERDIQIPILQKALICIMGTFLCQKQFKRGGNLTEEMILDFTNEEWDQFPTSSTMTNPVQKPIYNHTTSDLQNFIRGVKCDKSQYSEIKDESHFDNWEGSFLATAQSHCVEEVFNPDYMPKSEDAPLFEEKLKFAYTVLDATLKTDMGKPLVRKYKIMFDTQKIWAEFVMDERLSTKAQIILSNILTWIMAARYDNSWKKTSSAFVLYWANKVREYESFITDPLDRFSNAERLSCSRTRSQILPSFGKYT